MIAVEVLIKIEVVLAADVAEVEGETMVVDKSVCLYTDSAHLW